MTQYQPRGFRILTPAVKHLLIINVLLYVIDYVLRWRGISLFDFAINTLHMEPVRMGNTLIPMGIGDIFGIWTPSTGNFRLWQPFTYMFMHASFDHLFFNMFSLWMFGYVLENVWGTRRFLLYYFACGLGAGLLNLLVPGVHLTMGASAAIYGILLAFGMLFPNERIYLYFLVPIKTKWFIIGMIVIELFEGIFRSYDGIAHFAHLGGMLIGFLLILYWKKHPFSKI